MTRTAADRRRRLNRLANQNVLSRSCSAVVESLEPRQLLTASYIVERISVTSDEIPATAASGTSSVSADGNLVVFTSSASLVDGVPSDNALTLIYLRNRATGETSLISKGQGGVLPNNKADEPMISGDGKFVVYSSPATNLVPVDLNDQPDIFLYDIEHGVTTLLSVGLISLGSAGANSTSSSPTISSNGQYVAFLSNADNLVANDTNGASDVFIVDTTSGAISRMSATAGNVQANGASYGPVLSSDGNYVAFLSDATNLATGADTNNVADVFLKSRVNGGVQRVSVSTAGAQANGKSNRIAINGNGTFVAFESSASNLVSGDTNNPTNDPERYDIFLRDLTNPNSPTTTRVSVGAYNSASFTQSNGVSTKPSISSDGTYITYTSTASNLVDGDTGGHSDVFLFNRLSLANPDILATRRLSVGPSGIEVDDDSDDAAISGNGRYISFRSTATTLLTIGTDQNGVGDIFVRDRLAAPLPIVSGDPNGNNPVDIDNGNTTTAAADGTDFGIADLTTSGVTHTFKLRNTGNDRLLLTGSPAVKISGANANDFIIDVQPVYPNDGAGIDPDEFVTFVVRFKPTAVGIRTATVTILTNDPAGATYSFAVSGTATDQSIESRMVIKQGTNTVPTGTATPVAFGNLPKGTATPKTLTFTVLNVSAEPITLDPVALSQQTGFVIQSQFDPAHPTQTVTIEPGHTATFTIAMLAATAGDATATVTLSNTANSDTKTASFDVAGTVTVPQIKVLVGTQALTKGQTFDFGPVVKGSSAVTKTFTIRNDGPAPLTLGALTVPDGYVVVTLPPSTIAPGATGTFVIRLDSSTAVGAKNGTLSLVTNDPNANPYTLALTGSVTTPGISVSVDGSDVTSNSTVTNFGTGFQGQTGPTKTFTIKNTGTAALNVSLGTMPTGFTLVSAPAASVGPGATTTFVIRLATTSISTPSGSLTITTNASPSTFTLKLSGTVFATAPKAVLLVDGTTVGGQSISFGTALQGSAAATRTVTVRNDGNVNLVLGTITLPAGYSVATALGLTTLSPGATTTFTVAFTPVAAGVQAGVLSVATNEGSRNAVSAGVTATVTAASKTLLGVDSVSLSKLPSIILGGTKTATGTATVTLNNFSAATITGSYKITVYAASGTFARPGIDKVLGTLAVQVNLKSKAKSAHTVKLSFPAPPVDQAYNIVAVVTGPKADPAYNFNRAPFAVRIEKAQAKIGATPGAGAAPVTGSLGKKVTQSITFTNSGNLALTGTLSGDLFLSKDGSIDNAVKITSLAGLKINNLAPKKSQKVSISFTLPKTAPAGFKAGSTYTLIFKLKKVASATPNTIPNDGLVPSGKITLKA